jgi:hypothetical protein
MHNIEGAVRFTLFNDTGYVDLTGTYFELASSRPYSSRW